MRTVVTIAAGVLLVAFTVAIGGAILATVHLVSQPRTYQIDNERTRTR